MNIDFRPKCKAIGLPFLQIMAGSENIDFIPKGEAIGVPFSQKNSWFQEY